MKDLAIVNNLHISNKKCKEAAVHNKLGLPTTT
jgi:hypothetical protein